MGRVMSRPLDRQRPLWELWVFELPDNKLGMIQKTHHCLIDGISGVDLGTVLLDVVKEPPTQRFHAGVASDADAEPQAALARRDRGAVHEARGDLPHLALG